jgi:signal transduction histidine kinase
MSIRLKTKFSLGLIFLFIIIFAFGTLGIFHIYRLSSNARLILQQNHNSLVFSNNMLLALEEQPVQLKTLEKNLALQIKNVTEAGEGEATTAAKDHFELLLQHPDDNTLTTKLRQDILQIVRINQEAIILKNRIARVTASNAIVSLSIILLLLTIVSITFIIGFPPIITHPIQLLSAGISEISNRNYSTRIHLTQHDEFGELATVFNMMAGKLHEYESGNLARIRLEKTQFIATISHELKTPISAMKMSLSLLNDERIGPLQTEQQELLESIAEDVERMLKISTELLDMAQEEIFAHEIYPVNATDNI